MSALLTAEQVAERLGVTAGWVYAETRAGRIPHVPLGRYRRYRPESIEQWLLAAERGSIERDNKIGAAPRERPAPGTGGVRSDA